ncbi:hypothetical protein F2Q69_00009573 [Brassica cretica]|uniref:Uncharacterized protein n=1 Tax=Brassica cretica TaxID=69181 RepID=A0A8S9NYF9_BRACR|nr:hypothetical protein F2Q69_00009573 [Brassica cretica]
MGWVGAGLTVRRSSPQVGMAPPKNAISKSWERKRSVENASVVTVVGKTFDRPDNVLLR